MNKFMDQQVLTLFLVIIFMFGTAKAESWKDDPSESRVGIHLLSNYGADYKFISKELLPELIEVEINKLDWETNFYQFVIVIEPGISMEVGGSINPTDGLSAMFRDRYAKLEGVIVTPPASVKEMSQILIEFVTNRELWKDKYNFDFTQY